MKIYYKIKELFFSRNFVVFVIIGVINTLAYNLIYLFLNDFMYYLVASIIGYLISMTISYLLNCKYNFKVKPTLKKYLLFPTSGIPTFFMQTVGLSLFVEVLAVPEKFAGLLASLVGIPFSYLIMRYVIKK